MTEHDAVIKGLEMAMKMEADGRQFYLKAAEKSANSAGRQLFESLAKEEEEHAAHFKSIYERLKNRQNWDDEVASDVAPRSNIKTIFSKALSDLNAPPMATASEKESVEKAIDMEEQSYELYRERSEAATTELEKEFYQKLMSEERGHFLALNDYMEYLKDPSTWYTFKEHPTLDGA